MDSADAHPESTHPDAPPPLATWWGHTGLLYVGLSATAAAVGYLAALHFIWRDIPDSPPFLEMVLLRVQMATIYGAAVATVQWLVLYRLVLRALRTSRKPPSHAHRRLVRNTAWWIIMTLASTVVSFMLAVLAGELQKYCSIDFLYPNLTLALIDGLILGTSQWFLIRSRVPGAGRWILWTAVGTVLGGIVALQTYRYSYDLIQNFPGHYGILARSISIAYGVINVVVVTAFQAFCLKRLAPAWMKRLYDEAHAAPSNAD